jgi:hemoglobin
MARSGATAQSLYTRLGGYDVIAAFVDNWLALMAPHPRLGRRLRTMSVDETQAARQLLVDCIAERAGGPVVYTGPPVGELRRRLGVAIDDPAVLTSADAALLPLGVATDARDDLLAFVAGPGAR